MNKASPIVGRSVVSLFAGIGGFDLGFQRAGFRIAAHVEKENNCRKLLAAKWPDAVALDDVCTSGAHNLTSCDVVTFGFPCQDLSVAGKRAGLAGGRSGLFYEATRIINEIKPSYCLFENVPGLLSSDGGRDFARVLMEMDRIGYCGAWRVLDAQWFGVAQRRRRVFGLFSRLDSGAERCAEILSIPESLRGHPTPCREKGKGPSYDVAPCLAASGRGTERAGETRGQDCVIPAVAACLQTTANDYSRADGFNAVPVAFDCLNSATTELQATMGQNCGMPTGRNLVAVPVNTPWDGQRARVHDAAGTAPTLQSGAKNSGNIIPAVAMPVAQVQWASGGGKVHNPTAQALRSGAEHNYQFAQVGMQVRRLTPTECERIQGFPDGWTAGFSDSTRYRMLGNAVCVNVAAWIAGRMWGQG